MRSKVWTHSQGLLMLLNISAPKVERGSPMKTFKVKIPGHTFLSLTNSAHCECAAYWYYAVIKIYMQMLIVHEFFGPDPSSDCFDPFITMPCPHWSHTISPLQLRTPSDYPQGMTNDWELETPWPIEASIRCRSTWLFSSSQTAKLPRDWFNKPPKQSIFRSM